MLVEKDRQIALSADEPVHFSRPSIDVLFESAADVYGERLLGIILTGETRTAPPGCKQSTRQWRHRGPTTGHRPGASHGSVRPAARPGRFRTLASRENVALL